MNAKNFQYGLGRYYYNLDILPPQDPLQQIIKKNSLDFNEDIVFAVRGNKQFKQKNLKQFTESVLDQARFQNFLQNCFDPVSHDSETLNSLTNLPRGTGVTSNMIQLDKVSAQKQLDRMQCTIDKKVALTMLWYLNKIVRKLSDGLFVEEPGI